MDPSIMKKLLEDDEDESMHSGADVDAFQAALNRDIGGDLNPPSHPSASDSVVVSQGSNSTSSQSLPPFETTVQNEHTNHQVQRDQDTAGPQEINSSEKEPAKHVPNAGNNSQQHYDNASQEARDLALPQMQSQDDRQNRPVEQNPLQIPQATGNQIAGKNPVTMQEPDKAQNPDSESQYIKLQKMSNQQATVSEPASTPANRGKQVPFGLLLPVLMNQLDKDKGMQLQELFGKLKREEISKEAFVRLIRGVVGEQVLRLAVITVQSQLQSQASARKQPPGVPSVSSGPTQFTDPRSLVQTQQKVTVTSVDVSQIPSSKVQGLSTPSHQIIEKKVPMLVDVDRQSNSLGLQKHLHFSQASFTTYGGNGGNSHSYSGTNVNNSTLALKPPPHESQTRQMPQHRNMGAGGEIQGASILGAKLERQSLNNDPSRVHGAPLAHFSSNAAVQQRSIPWQPPLNRDQSTGQLSSSYVKPEPADQPSELQHKLPLSISQGPPSVSAAQIEQGSMPSGPSRDESFEKRPPTLGFSTSVNMVSSSSANTPLPNPVSSPAPMQLDPNIPLGPRVTTASGTPLAGNNIKTPPKKPSVGQKKPLEAIGSSPPTASKKQKVSGTFLDQSIEQLNDVTAVSGVNLREEEEQLFSGPKEDSRVSEASRKAVQEEEERLILQKNPLQKKLAEIMTKCGLKCISNDVERCLSLSVEERMRGLIDNLIRVSKQRVDFEKSRHQIITTSDIRLQILTMNRKAKEEWEKKQAEAEKLRKQNEPETNNGVDGENEKDEGRTKPVKMSANKEEDDKMRATAANVAARAAVGGDDMLSKWQLMAEQARQKREGGTDVASGSQSGKDANRKPSTPGRTTKDHQDTEKRSVYGPGGVRKTGKNQAAVPQTKVARSITVKDVVAVLEREPQMSKSTLVYRLYEKLRSDATAE